MRRSALAVGRPSVQENRAEAPTRPTISVGLNKQLGEFSIAFRDRVDWHDAELLGATKICAHGLLGHSWAGTPLRMFLAYSGVEHELVFHKETEDPRGSRSSELQKKDALANLPYGIDDGLVVCESNVCLMYLRNASDSTPRPRSSRFRAMPCCPCTCAHGTTWSIVRT